VKTIVIARHKPNRTVIAALASATLARRFVRVVGKITVGSKSLVESQGSGDRCNTGTNLEKRGTTLAASLVLLVVVVLAVGEERRWKLGTHTVDKDQDWMIDHAVNVNNGNVKEEWISVRLAII
jgi:hypothetical protein